MKASNFTAVLLCVAIAGCENGNYSSENHLYHNPNLDDPESGERPSRATASGNLPEINLSVPSDWRPHTRPWTRVYGAAANGDIDEARRRVVRGEGTTDDVQYGWADYLYQQQRIRTWTPIVIAAGIAAAVALSGGSSSGESPGEDRNWGVIQHRREADEAAERRGAPKPYGY